MRVLNASGIVCLALLLASSVASATLIGDVILIEFGVPDNPPIASFNGPVGPGPELNLSDEVFFDVDASSIWMNNVSPIALGFADNVFISFTDLDWVDMPGEIVGFVATPTPLLLGWSDALVTFGPHEVHIDLSLLAWDGAIGDLLHIDLITRHSEVPEPATMTLLALGLAGLAYRRRKRA